MLNRILPPNIDNFYSGHKLAIWCMIPIVFIKVVMGLTSLFGGYVVAQTAHKVALGTMPPEAAQLLVLLLARSGLSTFIVALFCMLALVRYRAMIPLTYVLILLEHTGRAFLLLKESKVTGVSSATNANIVLLALTVVGLLASLLGGSASAARIAASDAAATRA